MLRCEGDAGFFSAEEKAIDFGAEQRLGCHPVEPGTNFVQIQPRRRSRRSISVALQVTAEKAMP